MANDLAESGNPDNLTDGLTAFISPLFVKVWTVWFKTGKVKFQWNLVCHPPSTSIINQGAALVTGAASVIGTGSVVTPAKEFRSSQFSQFSQCFQHLSSSFIIFQHRQHMERHSFLDICAVLPWCSHGVHLPLENIGKHKKT